MTGKVPMPEWPLRKTAWKGLLTLEAGGITRYPEGGKLPFPWHGFFIHNRSENYFYVDWDADADEFHSYQFFDWDWRDFDGHMVNERLTFLAATTTTIYLYGYQYLTLIDPFTGQTADPAAELDASPFVRDPEFGPPLKPKPRPEFDDDDNMYDLDPEMQ